MHVILTTGDMQPNDTALHKELKKEYRTAEQRLLTEKLRQSSVSDAIKSKIPSMERDEIMSTMIDVWSKCKGRYSLILNAHYASFMYVDDD